MLANKFFSRIKGGARVILVGDPDQLPSVGAGNVFRELIDCGLITVTVLDQIFRQSKDSLIAYNAKFINEGNTKLYYGQDFVFMASNNQAEAAERIVARYCREIEESGIDRVQILSPFRSDGAASAEQLNEAIREVVNPFRSAEEEIKIGVKVFRSMTGSCRPKTLPRYPMATWDSSAISKMMKMELALDLTSVWAVSWSTA